MNQNELLPLQRCEGFILQRVEHISEIRNTAYIFTHEKTSAQVLHLYNDDPNNLFSIAFRTPVSDSTGVPHILEHSVLGGSKSFPLKDPFQELLKGSLQTFLNALTYPDKTVYPVSSQVEADFVNLVHVYCDAVFFPLLTPDTFRQEGWHFDMDSETGPVGIKGIVYNEMKGVFSDFASHVERRTVSHLFPDTSYFFESGGEPAHITDLTHEQFVRFHTTFYHPSNSLIVLYGNIPSQKTLAFLNKNYLDSFAPGPGPAHIPSQPDWTSPRSAVIEAPAPEQDNGSATIALAWKFGLSTDPLSTLVGRILYTYLMGTERSPLKRALIDSGLGEDLDDICGFQNDFIHGMFCVGLRKSKPERAESVESLVLATLKKQVESGLDERLLEGAIRQTEFRLREISDAGRFPYNLQLSERCFRSWLYGGDPLAHLAFEKPLSIIRSEKEKGCGWFEGKIEEMLIRNPHRLRITVTASAALGAKLELQSQEQAARLSAGFSVADKKRIVEETRMLVATQKKQASPETLATLPRLAKSDLPPRNSEVPVECTRIARAEAYLHPLFTAGIVYCDIGFDCTAVPADLLPYLPLYLELLSRCGAAGLSYQDMSRRVSLATGGIHGSLVCETITNSHDILFTAFVHAKSLAARLDETVSILNDIFQKPDLANVKQIKDILFEMRNDLNSSIIDSGHSFAVAHASAGLSKARKIDETLSGIAQLRFLDKLVRTQAPESIAAVMAKLHTIVVSGAACTVSITADNPFESAAALEKLIAALPESEAAPAAFDFTEHRENTGIEISSSVNFVAKAWGLGALSPQQTGEYLLLSRNLSTGYLWDKVRVEGGAYGGMASVSGGDPIFSCASYRDPNLASTLAHFEKSFEEIASGLSPSILDQSIIGAIGRLDTPRTPHQKGFGETLALLCGKSREYRQAVREGILSATPENLARAALALVNNPRGVISIVGTAASFDKAEAAGVKLKREPLL